MVSLVLLGISVILLMTSAAYHRIVERGEETEHFHAVAGSLLLAAMVTLPVGICGDFYVVVLKVTESTAASINMSHLNDEESKGSTGSTWFS
jgi:hypothetical protein